MSTPDEIVPGSIPKKTFGERVRRLVKAFTTKYVTTTAPGQCLVLMSFCGLGRESLAIMTMDSSFGYACLLNTNMYSFADLYSQTSLS